MKRIASTIFALVLFAVASAQPTQKLVTVTVTPAGASSQAGIGAVADSYNFDLGKQVKFNVEVKSSGVALDGVKASYAICRDKMPPHASGNVDVKSGNAIIKGGTMKEPGFLRCTAEVMVDGVKYSGSCAVGFAPERIKPAVSMPADFR